MPGPALQPFLDQQLTGISVKLLPEGYIAERVLTSAESKFDSGKIAGYTKDHLRIVNTVTGSRGKYPRVEVSTEVTTSYQLEKHGLSHVLVEEDFNNALSPFEPRKDTTEDLTTMLWTGKEKALADVLGATASFPSTNRVTLSGTDQYNDADNSDPLGDFSAARAAIWANSGQLPNKVIIPWQVWNVLKFHPQILNKLGFKYDRPGGLTLSEVAGVMEVDEVLVPKAVYNSAKEGQTAVLAPIWGKVIVFLYAPAKGSLKMNTFGFRIQQAGASPRRVFRNAKDEPPNSELIQVDDKYDQLIMDNTMGYLIKDAIA